ncbi:ComEC/Rec2 family competence protein [Alphaproteobacteria bacterium]|nr:ComEC/Rec2 family competence protein [Alphaproteobacteria bacterium]
MLKDKMALPPLKISDAYLLVWGLLCLVMGILLFGLNRYPWLAGAAAVILVAGTVLPLFYRSLPSWRTKGIYAIAIVFLLAGICLSALQHYSQTQRVLSIPEEGQIAAVIDDLSIRPNGRLRLELRLIDSRDFSDIQKVRVSIAPKREFSAGDKILADVVLFPLGRPAFAQRPDYARQHYFSGLSATGFISNIHEHQPAFEASLKQRLINWRRNFAIELNQLMPRPLGGIAAALLVGVRDFIPAAHYDSFRSSGLAHLLAISGLHMGLFCFSVYGLLRLGFALTPALSQRLAVRKLAAIAALIAGAIYLCLSGFPVSAIRAYLMACIVILAVLVDRRALTLHNLALVGCVMLALQPSLVYGAGFQLSFLASFAIIYVLSWVHGMQIKNRQLRWLVFIVASSTMAALITMPVIAYHFAQFTLWGVVANIIAIPLTGLLILPSGILVLIAGVFGYMPALVAATAIMAIPLGWLAQFSDVMASLPLAGITIKPPPAYLLVMFSSAAVMLATLAGVWRAAGVLSLSVTAILWLTAPQPGGVMLVSGKQLLVTVVSDNAQINTTNRLTEFWQSNIRIVLGSGEVSSVPCNDIPFCVLPLKGGRRLAFVRDRRALAEVCSTGFDYIISAARPYYPCRNGTPIHYQYLKRNERHLLYFEDMGLRIVSNLDRQPPPWRPSNSAISNNGE